ncbi:MAG TPA: glycosyltransferase [Candidatus Saccharimonadales bacterium]|nr:glycosyltransferase [Candidatus Saccharimonadales bacterium]
MYVIVIPTYNEKENVTKLISQLDKLYGKFATNIKVLVADDSSSDGTRRVVEAFVNRRKPKLTVNVITKAEKTDLGEAYLNAFRHLLKNEPKLKGVIQMDADLSHDPKYVAQHLTHLQDGHDLSVGSRYVRGGDVRNWHLGKHFLSRSGNTINRIILSKQLRDYTGGFNGLSKRALQYITKPDMITSKGYHFQVELKYRLINSGKFKVHEFPITFTERIAGTSKMRLDNLLISFRQLLGIRLRKIDLSGA